MRVNSWRWVFMGASLITLALAGNAAFAQRDGDGGRGGVNLGGGAGVQVGGGGGGAGVHVGAGGGETGVQVGAGDRGAGVNVRAGDRGVGANVRAGDRGSGNFGSYRGEGNYSGRNYSGNWDRSGNRGSWDGNYARDNRSGRYDRDRDDWGGNYHHGRWDRGYSSYYGRGWDYWPGIGWGIGIGVGDYYGYGGYPYSGRWGNYYGWGGGRSGYYGYWGPDYDTYSYGYSSPEYYTNSTTDSEMASSDIPPSPEDNRGQEGQGGLPPVPTEKELSAFTPQQLQSFIAWVSRGFTKELGQYNSGNTWVKYFKLNDLRTIAPQAPGGQMTAKSEQNAEDKIESSQDLIKDVLGRLDTTAKSDEYKQITDSWGFKALRTALQEATKPESDRVAGILKGQADMLQKSLERVSTGNSWVSYLDINGVKKLAEEKDPSKSDEAKKLSDKFDRVARNSEYQSIAQLPGFQGIQSTLQNLNEEDKDSQSSSAKREPPGPPSETR